jgi:hypothetical protein
LDCGCIYYEQRAGELAAQVQKTIKEEKCSGQNIPQRR